MFPRYVKRMPALLPPVVFGLLFFGGWELLVRVRDIQPLTLPAPSAIANEVFNNAGQYAHAARITVGEAALGFLVALVAGIAIAAAMLHVRLLEQALDPYQVALRCTPVIAIAPALMLSFGFGATPKIVMAAVIAFAPFLVNALTGLRSIDAATHEVLRSANASSWEVFRVLRVPHALPYLFAAARVCISLALMGAVVAEWTGSSDGLGYRIISAQKDLETTTVWGSVAVLALCGVVLTGLVKVFERRALRNHRAHIEGNNW